MPRRPRAKSSTPPRFCFPPVAPARTTGHSPGKTVAGVAAGGATPESLAALVLLAQQRAGPPANQPAIDVAPLLPDLIASIEAHPLAKTMHHLLVADLLMAQEPAKRAELIQAAIDRYGKSKDEGELTALAAWLYGKGEFDKVLTVLPLTRAVTDRALYLQYLDTLAALGRWTEIRGLIQARKSPLDPMISQMFLARCASQLGETEVRDARWQAALDAAGTDPNKLLAVGQYAEKNGVVNTAAAAFRAAVQAAPDGRAGYEELVRPPGIHGQHGRTARHGRHDVHALAKRPGHPQRPRLPRCSLK